MRRDVAEDRGVEVGSAQAFDPFRPAQELKAAGVGLPKDGRVKGAAAKVVDGDGAAVLHPHLGGVMQGCRLRLADQGNIVQAPGGEGFLDDGESGGRPRLPGATG